MRASTSMAITSGHPSEAIDPVDAFVDERAAGHAAPDPRTIRACPTDTSPPRSTTAPSDGCSTTSPIRPCVDPRLEPRAAQAHQALERHARHAGRIDRFHHPVRLRDRHRHRLSHDDVFAGPRRPDRQLRNLRHRRRDLHDIHIVALDQRIVVAESLHPERPAEHLELRRVMPRRPDDLRPRILPNRARQTERRIPMPEAENRDPPAFVTRSRCAHGAELNRRPAIRPRKWNRMRYASGESCWHEFSAESGQLGSGRRTRTIGRRRRRPGTVPSAAASSCTEQCTTHVRRAEFVLAEEASPTS